MTLRVAELRRAACLSQAELADKARIRTATLSEIENGRGNPRLTTLVAIAEAIDRHPSDLFEKAEAPENSELLELIRKLSDDRRTALLTLLRPEG